MSTAAQQLQRRRRIQQQDDLLDDGGAGSGSGSYGTRPDGPSRNSSSSSLGPASRHPLRASQAERSDRGAAPPQSFLRNAASYSRNVDADHEDFDDRRKSTTTLDKLEEWFGLRSNAPLASSVPSSHHDGPYRVRAAQQRRAGHADGRTTRSEDNGTPGNNATKLPKGQRLVLVHSVAPTDTLEGLALRYKTDVRALRRANGLWPGDSVQTRSEIYIPVDENDASLNGAPNEGVGATLANRATPNSLSAIRAASEGASGQLTLLNSQNLSAIPHDPRHGLGAAARSAASVSSAASGRGTASPSLRVVPVNALSYFPSPQSSQQLRDRISTDSAREAGRTTFGLADGLQLDHGADTGENGIEDLLQLAERAKMRGSQEEPDASESANTTMTPGNGRAQMAESDSASAVSSQADLRSEEEPWRPNKWTLGEKKRAPAAASADDQSETSSAAARTPTLSGTYQGWNDIPEPSLSATAKGKVAHAYKNKRRYPRPGAAGVETPGLIDDLVAGLPPNSGPASHWARPIADSLPTPEAQARAGGKAGRPNASAATTTTANATSGGWGQMLSDTVRGKMRLEDALERGFEDLRQGLASVTSSDLPAPDVAARQRAGPPSSAAPILGNNKRAGPPPPPPPSAPRRPSNKSLHELVDLRPGSSGASSEDDFEDARAGHDESAARRDASNDSSGLNSTVPGATGMRGRRNMRNVDWLS